MNLKSLRSLLFIPATSTALLPKATQRGADALIVDLEDAIPFEQKPQARPLAANAIRSLTERGATVLLRLNSEPELWRQDLAQQPLHLLAGVMLPKVESFDQIEALAVVLAALVPGDATQASHTSQTSQTSNSSRTSLVSRSSVPITIQIETPRGVLNAAAICAHPDLAAVGFGAEDYSAALAVPPTPSALAWPAQQVVTCAHAFSLPCWGLAASIAQIDDPATYAVSVREARAMGFTGTVCIHPNQVQLANQGFSPSAAELAWAQRVVEADRNARAEGIGAILLDGRMIDRPIVERARRWLELPQT
jgi:citrate lyase subunit beta / citryl-CoA lyase